MEKRSSRAYSLVRAGIFAGAVLVVFLATVAARLSYQFYDANRWLMHTADVIGDVRATRMLLGSVDSPNAPVETAKAKLAATLDQLGRVSQKTRDNEWQQKNVSDFRGILLSSATSSPGGHGPLLSASALDAANEILDRMQREEYGLLIDRSRHQAEITREAAIAIGLLCLGLVGLGLFTTLVARSEYLRRQSAERILVREKQELTRHSQELALVSAGSELIQAAQDEAQLNDAVGRVLRDLLPGSSGYFGLVSPSKDLVEVCARWGGEDAPATFAPSECVALQLGRPIHRSQALINVGCGHMRSGAGDSICMPVRSATGHLGVLHLQSTEVLAKERADSVALFAAHVALGLTNLRMREALRRQTVRDPLTGLFNRRYFDETLHRELSAARRDNVPLSVLMLDVDHFKQFNDTYGHVAGDDTLRQFGVLLRTGLRESDVVCRYGGEEFAVIVQGANLAEAFSRAERLRKLIEGTDVSSGGRTFAQVTTSIGIACSTEFGHPEELVHAADVALYQAKRMGRNACWACSDLPGAVPAIPTREATQTLQPRPTDISLLSPLADVFTTGAPGYSSSKAATSALHSPANSGL